MFKVNRITSEQQSAESCFKSVDLEYTMAGCKQYIRRHFFIKTQGIKPYMSHEILKFSS